ncbi:hypothetical protein L210DRAFT_945376 [Boletus edulis BED1]|uniref:Uncharacterized protein n=1 Tax=Boletus edulis BED1 TaxID=1328754 RepID=A0AAD4G411_BOLED|nr:hypothetical protein L210DRAFT_945376 [Boletus edulis BED1]
MDGLALGVHRCAVLIVLTVVVVVLTIIALALSSLSLSSAGHSSSRGHSVVVVVICGPFVLQRPHPHWSSVLTNRQSSLTVLGTLLSSARDMASLSSSLTWEDKWWWWWWWW